MEKSEVLTYWIESSDTDYKAMNHLFEKGDYSWSLFVGHLVIEKLLKACFVKHVSSDPPKVHNLLRLVEKCELQLTEDQLNQIDTITAFNMTARYDSVKREFFKKCTKPYTKIWLEHIKGLRKWIKKEHLS